MTGIASKVSRIVIRFRGRIPRMHVFANTLLPARFFFFSGGSAAQRRASDVSSEDSTEKAMEK